jgi:hypothetical protein
MELSSCAERRGVSGARRGTIGAAVASGGAPAGDGRSGFQRGARAGAFEGFGGSVRLNAAADPSGASLPGLARCSPVRTGLRAGAGSACPATAAPRATAAGRRGCAASSRGALTTTSFAAGPPIASAGSAGALDGSSTALPDAGGASPPNNLERNPITVASWRYALDLGRPSAADTRAAHVTCNGRAYSDFSRRGARPPLSNARRAIRERIVKKRAVASVKHTLTQP